jgi:polar amino acid transport system permease protein
MGFQFQFEPVLAEWPFIWDGVLLTIGLSLGAITLGSALALLLTAARQLGPRPVRALVEAYVELLRNTPFLVQLFLIFFGLSGMGLRLTATQAALLAMTMNLAAYCVEIIRAGVDSIHKSQVEAGLSLALTRWQVLQHVVVVPAVAKVWPALSSQFVLMMLASSICSFISAQELSGVTAIVEQRTFRSFESYIVATVLYVALALLLKALLALIGRAAFPRVSGLERIQARGEAA